MIAAPRAMALEGRPFYEAAAAALGGSPEYHAALVAKALALDWRPEPCPGPFPRDTRCRGDGTRPQDRMNCPACDAAWLAYWQSPRMP